ncbi:SMI1/KNR4 family protein [Hymenobacter sp. CRA2]|uniref:SMI1/KNR4 family protein n=1 Tax=Hymenobacter sp. CRA2 TaxID=1955620 RepID=UPI0009900E94|nr:SMI1/KNR4 family protein [Hymenobacter sp. CRA2]OON69091.1 hypothetical protein B0919_10295 [Hymenobacter sp. CRA2]
MKAELITRLRRFLAQHKLFGGQPATEAQLAGAEQGLGVRFEADYRQFMALFGGSYVGVPVYGFNNCAMLPDTTVVGLTLDLRAAYRPQDRWPVLERSYVVSMTGSGDPIIINAQGLVVVFYHDCEQEDVLAATFQELIEQNLPD